MKKKRGTLMHSVWLMAAIGTLSTPALAHHPMGGAMPDSALEGLLSGLGHPLIEVGHLVFLLGAALLAAVCAKRTQNALAGLALFVAASMAGTLITLVADLLALAEIAIGLTLLALVPLLWRRRIPATPALWAAPVLAGLVHGLAYGEAVIGAEPTPIFAYLVGLALIQSLMAVGVYYLVRAAASAAVQAMPLVARASACVAAAAGLAVTAGVA